MINNKITNKKADGINFYQQSDQIPFEKKFKPQINITRFNLKNKIPIT